MTEVEEDTIVADPIGIRLKAAREAQGMSLDDIAAKTRVPIRHLQHMEKGDWDELPAPTYSVGFARAYANAVGLNGSEIGAELRAQLGSGHSYATPAQYEPADPARVPPRALAIVAAVIAILLAGAYLMWRSGAVDDTAVNQGEIAGIETEEAAGGAAAPEAAVVTPAAPATGPVVLTAVNDVWLRVYEANGRTLYESTLKTGDRFEVPASAARPQILTGRPDALRVTVGSTQIPQLGPAEKTIADVSLLPADLIARATAPAPGTSAPKTPAPTTTPAPVPVNR